MQKFPNQASVYWFDPEPVKGNEIKKIRPCVVVSPNVMNKHLKTVIVAPLTSTVQPWPFRLTVKILGQKSSIACDQIRVIDKSRLKAHTTDLNKTDKDRLLELIQSIFI